MKLLLILDPLDELKPKKDTSIAIMREASSRGHEIYVAMQGGIYLQHNEVKIHTSKIAVESINDWYSLIESQTQKPNEFDAILMRKDPPFDNEYLYSTYLLELAQQQGGKVFNDPVALRGWNEKLSVSLFAEFAPDYLVTKSIWQIKEFLGQHEDIVVKPLDGMGGASVFRLTLQDPNINVILETITQFERRTIMAQRYIPEIKYGDKRIILINGEPLPYSLARIPKTGETRGNLAAGGTGVAQAMTERDYEIASSIGKKLKDVGLFLVGLDVIGDYLTEINVTSPTGMVEIATQTDCNPASLFIDALEQECAIG